MMVVWVVGSNIHGANFRDFIGHVGGFSGNYDSIG
jgi:hypothetical protein